MLTRKAYILYQKPCTHHCMDPVAADFHQKIDTASSRLLKAYRNLLRGAELSEAFAPHQRLKIETSASEIVFNAQILLDLIHHLKIRCQLETSTLSSGATATKEEESKI